MSCTEYFAAAWTARLAFICCWSASNGGHIATQRRCGLRGQEQRREGESCQQNHSRRGLTSAPNVNLHNPHLCWDTDPGSVSQVSHESWTGCNVPQALENIYTIYSDAEQNRRFASKQNFARQNATGQKLLSTLRFFASYLRATAEPNYLRFGR